MKSRAILCALLASSAAVAGAVAPQAGEAKTYKKVCSHRIEAISLKYIGRASYPAEITKLEKEYRCTIPRG